MSVGLDQVLLLGAALFAIGVWGALSQQSIVMIMMGLEMMINGVLVTVIGFWHFVQPASMKGQLFAIIVFTVMAIEAAIGFAIVIAIYRARKVDMVDDADDLSG